MKNTDIWSNRAIVSRSDAILEKSLRRKKKNATMWWFWYCGYPSPLFSMHGHGIYFDSMPLVPVVCLSEPVYAPYTQFLTFLRKVPCITVYCMCINKLIKVSKFQKQFFLFLFEPKNEQNHFFESCPIL